MTALKEVWKDISGFEGRYQVSNLGNVKSLPRIVRQEHTQHNHAVDRNIKGCLIHPSDNGNGYKMVLLRLLNQNGKRKRFYVHRLVAEHFIGEIPKGMVVNHIDYNKSNNCVSNLEIVTQAESTRHSAVNMRKPALKSHSKAGAKHIYMRRRGYSVEIVYNKVNYYGGGYKTIEEAIKKRDELYEKIHYYR